MIDDFGSAAVEDELERWGATIGRPLSIAVETASTNDDARAAAGEGAPHGATFVADAQTKGRGRGGHVWHSPPGENLYLSVVARTRVEPARVPAMSLVVGLAVARAVDRLSTARSSIKWPNDVEVKRKKIAGVLVEAQIRGGAVDALVIGVGLNVLARSFPDEIAARATSLALEGAEAGRARALAVLLAELGAALADFEARGLASAHAELVARDALRGARIRVGEIEGEGVGIDDQGRLAIRDERGQIRAVSSGSVEILARAAEVRSAAPRD